MLVPLVAQITLVRAGVREVPGRRVVHDGFGGLADGGDHSLDQEQDEKEAQAARMVAAIPPGIKQGTLASWTGISAACHAAGPYATVQVAVRTGTLD